MARSAACGPISRHVLTGSRRPFTVTSPSGSRANVRIKVFAVASPTTIVPGPAMLWSRAATFVVSPIDTAWGEAAPTSPTAVTPVLIPMRTLKSEICHALLTSSAYRCTSAAIASAVRAARSASSSWARGKPKKAAIPSPMYACTMPPNCSTAWLIRLTHSPMTSLVSSGLRRSPRLVEPTMSANSAVTSRSSSSVAGSCTASAGTAARAARDAAPTLGAETAIPLRLRLDRLAFDLEGSTPDLHEVPVVQRTPPLEPPPIDPRAVEGA